MPSKMLALPLYGQGFDHLGRDGRPISLSVPRNGPDELFCRHDAVGLCGSDYAVIRSGQDHANIHRDLVSDPAILGHEVALTVLDVGEHLRPRFSVGDRFVVQPDIFVDGVRRAYGYEIPGGLSQYTVLDQRVLDGEGEGYLLPLEADTGYAEAALTEPWACVEAAYHTRYRTAWKEDGALLVVGRGRVAGWEEWATGTAVLSDVSSRFELQFHGWAAGKDVRIEEDDGVRTFDDILVLGNDADLIESVLPRLSDGGILCVVTDAPITRRVELDVGRIHYDGVTVVGTSGTDVRDAYRKIRSTVREGGGLWTLGASGPSGWMHMVRALEMEPRPALIAATNLRSPRLAEVVDRCKVIPSAGDVRIIGLTEQRLDQGEFRERLWKATDGRGFDDIIVLAPSAAAVSDAVELLAPGGVVNMYAGISRGSMACIDLDHVVQRGVRFIGSSGSTVDDMRRMLDLTERGVISTNQWVSAIGSLEAGVDGLRAVAEGRFPGKVVIYPNIEPLPLTPLSELASILPAVHRKLGAGESWTVEAEKELLETHAIATTA